jgi:hypothetical protein
MSPAASPQAVQPFPAATVFRLQPAGRQRCKLGDADRTAGLFESGLVALLDEPFAEHPVPEAVAVAEQEVPAFLRNMHQLLEELGPHGTLLRDDGLRRDDLFEDPVQDPVEDPVVIIAIISIAGTCLVHGSRHHEGQRVVELVRRLPETGRDFVALRAPRQQVPGNVSHLHRAELPEHERLEHLRRRVDLSHGLPFSGCRRSPGAASTRRDISS